VSIGAGFSGINLALQVRDNVPGAEVVLYDRASDAGGVCEWQT
jgi:cation diffusion facilitator CzcD-associated flavoprotein CzcO